MIDYRLPVHIKPIKYNIRINPIGPKYDYFEGECRIIYKNSQLHLNYITLNACDLDIKTVKLFDYDKEYPCEIIKHDKISEKIFMDFPAVPKKGLLIIKYIGKISDGLTGFYKVMEKQQFIMYTQFEPISARRCFPCFDEPNFKAIFKLEIMAPSNKLVLSNTSIDSTKTIGDKILYKFKETPIMPTYLVAFYIGHSDYLESVTKHNIKIRIYSSRDKKYSTFALDIAVKCLEYLTKFFD